MVDQTFRANSQVLAAAVLFGASAPLAKALMADVEPVPLAALLYLGSGIGTLGILGMRRIFRRADVPAAEARLVTSDLRWLIGAILAGGVAAPIVLLYGLRSTPAATASLLLSFEAVTTTLLAALAFHETIGRRVWAAVGLVTLGSVLLSFRGDASWGLSMGAIGVLAGCVLWGLDNNLTRQVSGKDPIAIVAIKGLGASLFSLVLVFGLGAALPSRQVAVEAMALGFGSYGLSIALFIQGLRHLGAARTAALFGTAPFLGAVISFTVFRETPSPLFLASLPLMAGGALLLFREPHEHEHHHVELVHEHRHSHDDGHHNHIHTLEETPASGYHSHPHRHDPLTHSHPHTPDLHHDHRHS